MEDKNQRFPLALEDDGAKFATDVPDVPEESHQDGHKLREDVKELWNIKTLRDALDDTSEEPPWVIQDLLLKDTATLVSAHPHSMKSLSLLCACMQAVATKQVWGRFLAPTVKKSLFIETEDPQRLVSARIRGFAEGLGLGDDLPGFYYACVGAFDLLERKQQIVTLLRDLQPDFAVLSTLQGLLGGRDWLRQDQMAPINAMFVEISRTWCPLIVVTHSPWNKKDRRAAGTITQAANFATNVHFQKTGDFVHVAIDSKAGAEETDFHLRLNTEGDLRDYAAVRSLVFAGNGWPKGKQKQAVLAALEDDPDATSQDIAERVKCGVRYVQKIRKQLAHEEE